MHIYKKKVVNKQITILYLCWDVVIEPHVWRDPPKLPKLEARFSFPVMLFILNSLDSQCWHNISHVLSKIQFGLVLIFRAFCRLLFMITAPRISKFLLAHLWSGGQIENFFYNKETKFSICKTNIDMKIKLYN